LLTSCVEELRAPNSVAPGAAVHKDGPVPIGGALPSRSVGFGFRMDTRPGTLFHNMQSSEEILP
jgi:hypothetical protein